MISAAFHTAIFVPLYNGLVALISVVPNYDVGLATIALTLVVKLLLYPVAREATRTQIAMKKLAPKLEELKIKYKDKEQQAKKMLELYKEHHIHPLSGLVPILVQLPIIIGLYWVFLQGHLPEVDTALLYSFTPVPSEVNMIFLGLVNLAVSSLVLAVLAGVSQMAYAWLASPVPEPAKPDAAPSFQNDFARSMSLQMRYVLPLIVGFIAYQASAGVALYLTASNLFSIAQEYWVRRGIKDEPIEIANDTQKAIQA